MAVNEPLAVCAVSGDAGMRLAGLLVDRITAVPRTAFTDAHLEIVDLYVSTWAVRQAVWDKFANQVPVTAQEVRDVGQADSQECVLFEVMEILAPVYGVVDW